MTNEFQFEIADVNRLDEIRDIVANHRNLEIRRCQLFVRKTDELTSFNQKYKSRNVQLLADYYSKLCEDIENFIPEKNGKYLQTRCQNFILINDTTVSADPFIQKSIQCLYLCSIYFSDANTGCSLLKHMQDGFKISEGDSAEWIIQDADADQSALAEETVIFSLEHQFEVLTFNVNFVFAGAWVCGQIDLDTNIADRFQVVVVQEITQARTSADALGGLPRTLAKIYPFSFGQFYNATALFICIEVEHVFVKARVLRMIRRDGFFAFNFDANVETDGAADGRFVGSFF
uniref:Uncharacterized protein n=1 Tax=Romanomermis culicivorax TaxID=13658 RepID=A0A915IT98_ROMCU